jgi:hypothetical protein
LCALLELEGLRNFITPSFSALATGALHFAEAAANIVAILALFSSVATGIDILFSSVPFSLYFVATVVTACFPSAATLITVFLSSTALHLFSAPAANIFVCSVFRSCHFSDVTIPAVCFVSQLISVQALCPVDIYPDATPASFFMIVAAFHSSSFF